MQKTLSFFIISITLATTACGLSVAPREGRIGKLTDRDQTILTDINDIQMDNIDARENSEHSFTMESAVSDKVAQMSKAIRHPNCTHAGIIPDYDLSGTMNTHTINGATCPIYWFRQRGYTASAGTLRLIDNFSTQDTDFRKLSPTIARRADGVMQVRPEGSGSRVTGSVKFNQFEITGYGKIQVSIDTDAKYRGDEGEGIVAISLSAMNTSHTGSISWTIRNGALTSTRYTVDNVKIEAKEFERLFSSFELSKIMDNSRNMK